MISLRNKKKYLKINLRKKLQIRDFISKNDVLIVNEGANTMDIGRTMMPSSLPRRRLDAGTFGKFFFYISI